MDRLPLRIFFKSKLERNRKLRDEQKPTDPPKVDAALVKKLKIEEGIFRTNFEYLVRTWWDSKTYFGDCYGKRLINEELFADLKNPVKLLIIADDLEAFGKIGLNETNKIVLFELCCLCGSEKIIFEDLLKRKEGVRNLLHSEEALAFAVSTDKKSFILKLVKKAKELGREELGPVKLYAKRLFFSEKIEQMWKETSTKKLKIEIKGVVMEKSEGEKDVSFDKMIIREIGRMRQEMIDREWNEFKEYWF